MKEYVVLTFFSIVVGEMSGTMPPMSPSPGAGEGKMNDDMASMGGDMDDLITIMGGKFTGKLTRIHIVHKRKDFADITSYHD